MSLLFEKIPLSPILEFALQTKNRFGISDLDYVGIESWGPPRVKVRGGKGSWTEHQIGMLLSYFVLIKLSVIKCLFNYDYAIINYNKFLIVSLA